MKQTLIGFFMTYWLISCYNLDAKQGMIYPSMETGYTIQIPAIPNSNSEPYIFTSTFLQRIEIEDGILYEESMDIQYEAGVSMSASKWILINDSVIYDVNSLEEISTETKMDELFLIPKLSLKSNDTIDYKPFLPMHGNEEPNLTMFIISEITREVSDTTINGIHINRLSIIETGAIGQENGVEKRNEKEFRIYYSDEYGPMKVIQLAKNGTVEEKVLQELISVSKLDD